MHGDPSGMANDALEQSKPRPPVSVSSQITIQSKPTLQEMCPPRRAPLP